MADTDEQRQIDVRACPHGGGALVDVAQILQQDEVDASGGEQPRVVADLRGERPLSQARDVGGEVAGIPVLQRRRRDAARHVRPLVAGLTRGQRVAGRRLGIGPPVLARVERLQAARTGPEVVAGDDVGAHPQVVLVDLPDHVAGGQVGGRRPCLEPPGRPEQHVDPAPLQLRPRAAVKQQPIPRPQALGDPCHTV